MGGRSSLARTCLHEWSCIYLRVTDINFVYILQWHIVLFLFLIYRAPTKASKQECLSSFSASSLGRNREHSPFCYVDDFSSSSAKTCQDLNGIGSLDSTCILNSNLQLDSDLCVYGTGNLEISAYVAIKCPIEGCYMIFNVSGNFKIGTYAVIVAGSIAIEATNITLEHHSSLNTTSLGGSPPPQTSGTSSILDGSGGGHGGRGASCTKYNKTNWGGDVYSWSTLSDPWSYGSKGCSASADTYYSGGGGGGRIMLKANNTLYVDGSVSAEGGEGSLTGGGGSGGSIRIHAFKLRGKGIISAAGGRGWGGGGGGRISLQCYSKQDVLVTVRGGQSIGCLGNAGAAGTIFDKSMYSLKVGNDNLTTETETPLLDFPTTKLWSDVFVENNAKVLVPLLWTRVQVRGQIKLLNGGHISFGLSEFPISEFELVAEELLMSESVIKVFGAFRMYVKMLLMWDSKIQIDGGGNADVTTSFLEARNLVVLRQNSIIYSNAVLGVNGQGLLKLSGPGDAIKGQRLFLSLFYNIEVGPGSLLQAPLDDENGTRIQSLCQSVTCPLELILPPDDCHVNSSLSFSIQICRVEDLIINGMLRGSILHVHRARTVSINSGGVITAYGLGCEGGIGKGEFPGFGAGGGGGHGGKGGFGFFNGTLIEGGQKYGNADFPCELGSGSGGSSKYMHVAGGGLIVMGSSKWPLSMLRISGSLSADGQSQQRSNQNSRSPDIAGIGGGSGGTVLLFLQELMINTNASLTASGGNGSQFGGGGGGGGRVHFHWSKIATGDEYVKFSTINGFINSCGGNGSDGGWHGDSGTITGSACPKGLFGTFCSECPVGTYKSVVGSDPSLCIPCSLSFLPRRGTFTYVRGGVTQPSCPYRCLSDKFKMPKCYTPLEELVYAFGSPWLFAVALSFFLILLAFLLNTLRIKLVGTDGSYQSANSMPRNSHGSFPYLLSLAEVQGTSKAEETQSHVHRMYFMGPNTFREPWHLPHSPPDAVTGIVYEDAFNRFIDEVNSVAAYEWWEGSVYCILSVLAYPCAWSWKQWRRKSKVHRLQEYVKSEYDHACLRSCRSRALYKGMKVGSTPDLMVAYIDFFLGGDEKHLVVHSTASQRFPMCIIFGGDGSYMSPYYLHSDLLLSNLICQYVLASIWNRFIDGLNCQLRTVRQGNIRVSLLPVLSWLNSHANPQLEHYGIKIEMGWFQTTASGYYQLGILVGTNEFFGHHITNRASTTPEKPRRNTVVYSNNAKVSQHSLPSVVFSNYRRRITGGVSGGIINETTLKSLGYKRDYLFPFSLLLQNRKPIGLQETLQLLIAIMLLGDLTVTLLTLLEFYWISLFSFLSVLLIFPLSLLSPFPAGLNALFSRGIKRSSLSRIYALWNLTSLSNTIVSFISGILYFKLFPAWLSEWSFSWRTDRDDGEWWVLPFILLILKLMQTLFINWHISNQEIPDHSLLSEDPRRFWAS